MATTKTQVYLFKKSGNSEDQSLMLFRKQMEDTQLAIFIKNFQDDEGDSVNQFLEYHCKGKGAEYAGVQPYEAYHKYLTSAPAGIKKRKDLARKLDLILNPPSVQTAAYALDVGAGSEAVGAGSEAVGAGSEAVGVGSEAVGVGSEAVGAGSDAVGAEAVCAGSKAVGAGSEAVGAGSEAVGVGSKAVGVGSEAPKPVNPQRAPKGKVAQPSEGSQPRKQGLKRKADALPADTPQPAEKIAGGAAQSPQEAANVFVVDHALKAQAPKKVVKHAHNVGPTYMQISWVNDCPNVERFEVEYEEITKHAGHIVGGIQYTKGTETSLLVTGLNDSGHAQVKFKVRALTTAQTATPWSQSTRLLNLKTPRSSVSSEVREKTWSRFYPSPVCEGAGLPLQMPCLCCVVRKMWTHPPEMLDPLLGNYEAGHVLPYKPYGIVGSEADEAWNFVPICSECNGRMADTHLIDYFTREADELANQDGTADHRKAIASNLLEVLTRLQAAILKKGSGEYMPNRCQTCLYAFAKTFFNDGQPGMGGVMTDETTGGILSWASLSPNNQQQCFDKADSLDRWVKDHQGGTKSALARDVDTRIETYDKVAKEILMLARLAHQKLWGSTDAAINDAGRTILTAFRHFDLLV